MTTNIAESYNNVLRGVRGLPICTIIELTFFRTRDYFRDRGLAAMHMTSMFSPRVEGILQRRRQKSQFHRTSIYDRTENIFSVDCKRKYTTGFSAGDNQQRCQLGQVEAICSCNKPRLEHIPCSHVLAACRDIAGNDGTQYVSTYYTMNAIRHTWAPKMAPINQGAGYKNSEGPTFHPFPSTKRVEPGRPRTTRLQGDMDDAEGGVGLRRCRICKQVGHDRRSCPNQG